MSTQPDLASRKIGKAMRIDDGLGRYVEYVKTTFPKNRRLDGMRIVVDCANGASYRAAPDVLWELGADVVRVGVSPTGFNINERCGSTAPKTAVAKVRETRADVGLCFDGDADRLIIIDETGSIMDGDQILALFAAHLRGQGRLAHYTLVASDMSNMGMDAHLKGVGIAVERTDVGDRYVVEAMRKGGYSLGGEQSGHIIMLDHSTARRRIDCQSAVPLASRGFQGACQ